MCDFEVFVLIVEYGILRKYISFRDLKVFEDFDFNDIIIFS